MSRIGKLPVKLPAGVSVSLEGNTLLVKGPKGELKQAVQPSMTVTVDKQTVVISRGSDDRRTRAFHGLTRSVIANMVAGVSKGFQRVLEIKGVGYKAEKIGDYVRFDLGYSHPIYYQLPEGIEAKIEKNTKITVTGIDKATVGRTAATIRSFRAPEPYKGKGIKYDNEIIHRKVGKAGAK